MELIDIYDYSSLIEKWYLDTYGVEYDPYDHRAQYIKFEHNLGFRFEGTTKDNEYVRLDVIDKRKFFLSKIKYGFSTFFEESSCEE